MNCAELLARYNSLYALCQRRCSAARPATGAETAECLVECMKAYEPLRQKAAELGCPGL